MHRIISLILTLTLWGCGDAATTVVTPHEDRRPVVRVQDIPNDLFSYDLREVEVLTAIAMGNPGQRDWLTIRIHIPKKNIRGEWVFIDQSRNRLARTCRNCEETEPISFALEPGKINEIEIRLFESKDSGQLLLYLCTLTHKCPKVKRVTVDMRGFE